MHLNDNAQQAHRGGSIRSYRGPRAWIRWIAGATRRSAPEQQPQPAPAEQLSVHTTMSSFPTRLDCAGLPNGVVELLIDDFEEPTRRLFDIHDGHITPVEPGAAVPWASIAGSTAAWALALGPERNSTALQLTGDRQLAQRVLAALPPPR